MKIIKRSVGKERVIVKLSPPFSQKAKSPQRSQCSLHSPETMSKQVQTTAAAATTSTVQAESSGQPSQHQNTNQNTNPFLNIFSNFLKLFNLVLPPQKKNLAVEESAAVDEVKAETKPAIVRFPQHKDENLPSLKLEPDEIQERDTNPVVLWQVYAIGGFLVLRWAWTRWNERKTRKKPSNEEPPPPSS